MFTLLPAEYKNKLLKEYRARIAVISSFFILALLVLSVCLIAPSFLSAMTTRGDLLGQEKSLLASIDQKNEDNLSETLEGLKSDLNLLAVSSTDVSSILDAVDTKVTEGIVISKIEYTSGEETFSIVVSGVASSRRNLSRFADELKNEDTFVSVELPVSNLAKDTDAIFTISIEGKP